MTAWAAHTREPGAAQACGKTTRGLHWIVLFPLPFIMAAACAPYFTWFYRTSEGLLSWTCSYPDYASQQHPSEDTQPVALAGTYNGFSGLIREIAGLL